MIKQNNLKNIKIIQKRPLLSFDHFCFFGLLFK